MWGKLGVPSKGRRKTRRKWPQRPPPRPHVPQPYTAGGCWGRLVPWLLQESGNPILGIRDPETCFPPGVVVVRSKVMSDPCEPIPLAGLTLEKQKLHNKASSAINTEQVNKSRDTDGMEPSTAVKCLCLHFTGNNY